MSGLLGLDTAPDQPLMEAGLDSIGAVELRNAVSASFGVELPATITFDHPSPAALAQYIAARLAPNQAALLRPQAVSALPRQPAQARKVPVVPPICLQAMSWCSSLIMHASKTG